MTPDFHDPERGITLYCGDCLDIVPHLEGVDAVITDPPYGVEFQNEQWDGEIPDWLPTVRAIAPLVMFTTAPTTMWDYPRPDWVLNWSRPASNSRCPSGGFNHWSPILAYGKHKFPTDSISLHAIANAQPPGFPHPCPKPIRLMQWLIINSSEKYSCILDPFMGSGTTGIACLRTERKFIGIEKDPKHFQTALDRIKRELSQTVLQFA